MRLRRTRTRRLPTRTLRRTTRCNSKRLRVPEALAFQGAAGNSGSLFFCLPESSMRALILTGALALTLSLGACKNNDQADNTSNIDENLTAENIVSNDVTAIDAVTGDAANMAAESAVNDIGPANEL